MNVSLLRRWLALSALVLLAATWRLWTPQTVFPQIPFFAVLRTVPGWIDWLALAGMLAGLLGLLLIPSEPRPSGCGSREPRDRRQPLPDGRGSELVGTEPRLHRAVAWSAALFVGSLLVLVLLDQHRLQVWAYQFAIVALVIASLARASCSDQAASLLRLLTIGIYVWSAVSKLDYTFLHGLGPELLRGMLTAFGLEPGWMRPDVATAIALAFPLDELLVAGLLAFRRTRLFGLIGSIAMHLLLLATLGPWGLDHSWGVLLWNVYFIGQNVLLFAPRLHFNTASRRREPAARPGIATRLASWVVYAAVVLPVLEPFGWLDHWPGWAVYAPSAEKVRVSISHSMEPGRPHLPEHLRPYFTLRIGPSFPSGSRLDLWSIDALSTPIYPEERFHVGVAIAVLERYDLEHSAWLLVDSRANRFTGERSNQGYVAGRFPGDKRSQLSKHADSFWLNTRPRTLGGWGGTP